MQKTNTGKRFSLQTIVLIGVLAALVFALSSLQIQFGENARIHFGNVMCILSGLLFGPMVGGLAAGFGSMLYDFTNPLYFSEFWITFIMKFAMGFLAGLLARHLPKRLPLVLRMFVAGLCGQLLYIVLFLFKTAIMQYILAPNLPSALAFAATKAPFSLVNGLIAVAACTALGPALAKALDASGFTKRFG